MRDFLVSVAGSLFAGLVLYAVLERVDRAPDAHISSAAGGQSFELRNVKITGRARIDVGARDVRIANVEIHPQNRSLTHGIISLAVSVVLFVIVLLILLIT